MKSDVAPFLRGMLELLPILPGIIPFGLVVGVAEVQSGMTLGQALLLSMVGYAGSAQLVASQMLSSGSPLLLILGATFVVNLRFTMYSAALAGVFRPLSSAGKALVAFLLVDQTFALFMARLGGLSAPARLRYSLGAGLLTYLSWQVSTLVGALVGATLPKSWSLEYAVTLTFIALLVPALKSRPTLAAAASGALGATLTAGLPFKLNLLVGAALGIAVGLWTMHLWREREKVLPLEDQG